MAIKQLLEKIFQKTKELEKWELLSKKNGRVSEKNVISGFSNQNVVDQFTLASSEILFLHVEPQIPQSTK